MKYKCAICGKELPFNQVRKHIKENHSNLSEIDKMKLFQNIIPDSASNKVKNFQNDFIEYIGSHVLSSFDEYYDKIRWYVRSFTPFYNVVIQYREFSRKDLDIFFNYYIPYKKLVPNDINSLKLASIYCTFEPENTNDFYEKILKPRNAYTGHGGELSPWSKDFVAYKGMDEEEINKIRKLRGFSSERDDFDQLKNSCTVKYFMDKGMSEEEAKKALKEKQTTFSLKKCIEKYGEEKGKEVFSERQRKWMTNYKKQNYSNISQELFWSIQNSLPKIKMLFATNDDGIQVEHYNKEYKCKLEVSYASLDFYIPSLNKWIEFDGDYWHGEGRGNKERDRKREEAILKAMPGIQLKRIKERDYRKDPEKIISECVEWINSK